MDDQQPEPGDLTDPAGDADASDGDTTRHRRAPARWSAAVVGVAATLFVGSAAFAGAMMQPYLADRALVATKLDIARAATDTITTLWTYTPDNIDSLPDRASKYLTGDFAAKYRKDLERIAPANKQAEISLSTDVAGVAVESVDAGRASALVYTNTTSKSPKTKDIPALQFRSYQISLTREHGRWLATELAAITKFSVTPHL